VTDFDRLVGCDHVLRRARRDPGSAQGGGGGDEAVEQHGDLSGSRAQHHARKPGDLESTSSAKICSAGLPSGGFTFRAFSIAATLRAKASSSIPVPRPVIALAGDP
jgi:hypothetical protein